MLIKDAYLKIEEIRAIEKETEFGICEGSTLKVEILSV